MGCLTQIPNFSGACGPQMGGVRAIYFALRAEVESSFVVDDSWFVFSDSGAFRRIPGRGSFQSVAQVDETTGLTYWRDELQFTPRGSISSEDISLALLTTASPDDLIVVVELWSGQMMILGIAASGAEAVAPIQAPVFFAGGQIVTGTERTDANGLSFTLTSVHPFPALTCGIGAASNPSTD